MRVSIDKDWSFFFYRRREQRALSESPRRKSCRPYLGPIECNPKCDAIVVSSWTAKKPGNARERSAETGVMQALIGFFR